jgi:serine/threonine-protein kinase
MDERSDLQLRAESLFADLLVRDPHPSADRLGELCESHPELAPELERMHQHLAMMRAVLPAALPDLGGTAVTSSGPPQLGAFRCVCLLGRGGMGEVWEAEDLTLGRNVALKLLRDSWHATDAQIQRFQREAQAAGRVQHPGIVAVYQTGDHEGRPYIVQELVSGGRTLRDEIDDLHRLPELPPDHARRVAERFRKLADALAAAHAAGIVHRDLKPQNVLLTTSGEPKVADFGLALLASDESLSRTGEFLGTCFYASPEQIEGRAADERSDVFSLAATLYENLTLRRAFDGDSIRQVLRAVTVTDPPAPHLLRGRVPRDLSLIVMKALEKRPEHRYGSMVELRDELERFLCNVPIRARAPSLVQRARKWSQRHPTVSTALALSLGSSIALAILFARSERAREDATRAEMQTAALNKTLVATTDDLRVQKDVAEEVTRFLLGMFERAQPSVSAGEAPTLRELVDDATRQIRDGEVHDPPVRARILGVLGNVYQDLGDNATARPLLEEALSYWKTQGREQDFVATEVELKLIASLLGVDAEEEAGRRLAALMARIGEDPRFDAEFETRIHMRHADVFESDGRFDEAAAALARAEEAYERHPADPELDLVLRTALADSALHRNHLDQARVLLEELVADQKELLARAHPLALGAVNMLGMILIQEGRLEEAERLFLELCDDAQRTFDPDHPMLTIFRMNLARVWEAMGRYPEAESLYRELAVLIERRSGPMSVGVISIWNNVATCVIREGRVDEAEPIFREVWAKSRAKFGEAHEMTLGRQHNLAQALEVLGRYEEAFELQERVVALTPVGHPNVAGRQRQLESIRAKRAAEEGASVSR